MSHITIIISKGPGGGGFAAEDEVKITYTPPDDMKAQIVGKEVAKRIRWIESLPHADAAED